MENSRFSINNRIITYDEVMEQQIKKVDKKSPFIEANTQQVTLNHLKYDCIIPVFAKDNERTVAHHEFIESTLNVVSKLFPSEQIDEPEIRVSHQIKGRVPEAIHKPANMLLEHEKTVYYERMAFIIRIPTISKTINGNNLALTVGGVRSYNHENLFNKKSLEKFKIFIGFQNMVCCNMCVSTDGYKDELRTSSLEGLEAQILTHLQNFDANKQLYLLDSLHHYSLTEKQFAQVIGKSRLYQHLPKQDKLQIPNLAFNDSQLFTVAKDYYEDVSFARDEKGNVNLWNMYNLFTHANKSSYIDTFIDRNVNALDLSLGIAEALEDKSSKFAWFIE